MSLLDWFRRGRVQEDARLASWLASWRSAVETPGTADIAALGAGLDAMGLPEDDIEIEREMVEGLERLASLSRDLGAGAWPLVETRHHVVGAEPCHFSAPASMPDEPNEPGGRVLLTASRAIFVGGAAGRALPWHAVADVTRIDRDVVLIRTGRTQASRFRFNVFGDALCAAHLATELRR